MLTIRSSVDRGSVKLPWLYSRHSFSFGSYYDPQHMGFGSLRVINEDIVQPKQGFAEHSHRDMEIVTCVMSGALSHRDSLGNGEVIRPHELQRMTAGTGIRHSEFNHSDRELVHLLQIWILPNQLGLTPSYEQKTFDPQQKQNRLLLVASSNGRDGSLTVHQDIDIYSSILTGDQEIHYSLRDDRLAWLQVAKGSLTINGHSLETGDGVSIEAVSDLVLVGSSDNTEILLFDMGKISELQTV
jgi:redox-sensitive bicupin YhaK (pirin superfamily)